MPTPKKQQGPVGEQTAEYSLLSLVATKKILVCVGSGGVGKTTTAAALGLLAARIRRKTLVMTIDPARRLATALGLAGLDHNHQEVPAHKQAAAGLSPGQFFAMMLDPKETFDAFVRRYAPDDATVERLLRSNIYQQISTRLAGSQEYAAMEMLHQIWQTEDYDLLVLDTPPVAHAVDFLEAPQKMVNAVQSPAVAMFIKAYQQTGRLSLNVLSTGVSYIVKRLAHFTGRGFLDDIAGFLTDLSGLLGTMHERADTVNRMMQRKDVGFLIITGPDPRSIDEAIGFFDLLHESGRAPAAFIINKVHALSEGTPGRDELTRLMAPAFEGSNVTGEVQRELAAAIDGAHRRVQAMAQVDEAEIERLVTHCGFDYSYVRVPLFNEDIFDIAGLVKLGDYLV